MTVGQDPRIDPDLKAILTAFQMDGEGTSAPFDGSAPTEALLAFCEAAEPAFEGLFQALDGSVEAVDGVERSTQTIDSPEGHSITLYVHRPTDVEGSIPGMLHIRGGGMAMLSTAGPVYGRWRDLIAATGVAVYGVELPQP